MSICRTLATQLGVPANSFTDLHDPTKPCGTLMKLIRTEASIVPEDNCTAMVYRTDVGAVTLLANVIGGLQILPSGDPKDDTAWLWFKPQPGKLLVELGDIFVCWTGGILKSNIHRVRHTPGEQSCLDRYNFTVAAKPSLGARMHRVGDLGQESDLNSHMTVSEYDRYKTVLLRQGTWPMKTFGGKVILSLIMHI